jgi:ABC-type molybdate transport system substrate-binding protein
VIKASDKQEAARDFASFLASKETAAVFEKYGFIPLEK